MKKDLLAGEKSKVISYVVSVVAGAAVTFTFMLIFAALIVGGDLSDRFIAPATSLATAFGGLTAGFTASKILKSGGLLNGAVTGGALFLLVLVISLFADRGGLTLNTLFNLLIIMLSALIGGILGVGKKKKFI